MNKLYLYLFSAALLVALVGTTSCKKTVFYSSSNLSFSADTLVFDTVFTTVGSTTQQFRIYNNDSKAVTIQQIELMGGTASPFRINVDGTSGINMSNIDLGGNDSLFVFVEVTLDINGGVLPLVIEDSIRFRTNGVDQYVHLAVWGQDAYFHTTIFSQGIYDLNSGIWPNDKPHVIYGAAIIDSAESLTIQQGTDIFLHNGSYLFNYKGELHIEGTATSPVTLQGDRLESYYDDVAGSFYGIYMQEALPSTINYAIIRNGTSGVHLFSEDPANVDYTLKMSNTIIQNCASYGLFLYAGARVKAENCLIAKNGIHAFVVLEGGDFNFNNCHLVGYNDAGNAGAAVGISNHYYRDGATYLDDIDEGTITNSVIFGNMEHELVFDTIPEVGIVLNFLFDNNVIKSATEFTDPFFLNTDWNTVATYPQFADVALYDFTYSAGPLLDQGASIQNTIPEATWTSLNGNPRPTGGGRDIGAFEF